MQLKLSTDKMLAHKDGHVGHMVFNNVARHNAVSLEMWDAVEEILTAFEADKDIRVLVVSGAGGKSFVSGADISKFDSERGSKEAVLDYNKRTSQAYDRLEDFPKPTIAMINGYCIGGGLNLAGCCDLRFCSDKSKFGMPAARLGLGYGMSAINRLMKLVGPGNARDMMFSARYIEADEAQRIGYVQKAMPQSDLESFVKDYAGTIARNAPLTVAAMKFISRQVLTEEAKRDLAGGDEMVAACFNFEDYIEGRTAFMEKRRPAFKGR